MKKYYLVLIFTICFSGLKVFAQKCDRPKEVFIKLDSVKTLSNNHKCCLNNPDSFIYLPDSSEVFLRISELNPITINEYSKIIFQTTKQLREKEMEIRHCEVEKAGDTIYLDIDINSVFQTIYAVVIKENNIYQFRVRWVDAIE